ncbi:hypothetical protein F5888DRAFT_1638912 [Russula emetica]|nr:hypothetical protein F5888DRAFT_1638912 [Russula emetica]
MLWKGFLGVREESHARKEKTFGRIGPPRFCGVTGVSHVKNVPKVNRSVGCVSDSVLRLCLDSFQRQRGNDMETFSWFDSLRALTAPCLDCLNSSKNERNDLEDLLADSGSASATTADAETLSLHSNPGSPRQKRARFTKHIRLFGWDLFGRRQPIRLPDDDEEDEEEDGEGDGGGDGDGGGQEQVEQRRKKKRRSNRGGHRRPSTVTISSSTLDSDAAPLDSAAIVSHATNYAEEEAKRAERRERRRQHREMKRAAELALEQAGTLADGDEFEGFQGSGNGNGSRHMGLASSPPPLGRDDGTRTTRKAQELRYTPNEEGDDDDDDDDDGDFGADAYTRRTSGSSDSGRGSDSRSRTSTTTSVSGQQPTAYSHPHSGHSIQPYNHHYISQQPPAHTAATTDAPLLSVRRTKNKSSRSSASKSSSSSASSSKRSRLSPSAPLSTSLGSPVASAAPLPTTTTTTTTITPPTALPRTAPQETFEGFTSKGPRLQTVGIEHQSSSGFPSPGIGGPRHNGKRDMGAFLANRGDA